MKYFFNIVSVFDSFSRPQLIDSPRTSPLCLATSVITTAPELLPTTSVRIESVRIELAQLAANKCTLLRTQRVADAFANFADELGSAPVIPIDNEDEDDGDAFCTSCTTKRRDYVQKYADAFAASFTDEDGVTDAASECRPFGGDFPDEMSTSFMTYEYDEDDAGNRQRMEVASNVALCAYVPFTCSPIMETDGDDDDEDDDHFRLKTNDMLNGYLAAEAAIAKSALEQPLDLLTHQEQDFGTRRFESNFQSNFEPPTIVRRTVYVVDL